MAKKRTAKRTSTKTNAKNAWFYPVRGSYLPCSAEGWLLYLCFLLLMLVDIAGAADRLSRHQTGVWFEVVGYLLHLALGYYVLTSIARRHAKK